MNRIDWKLCLLLVGLNVALAGILLKAFGLVPPLILEVVLDIIGLVSVIGAFAQYLVPFLHGHWAIRHNRVVMLANIIGAIIIVGGISWFGVTTKTHGEWKSRLGPIIPLCEGSSGT